MTSPRLRLGVDELGLRVVALGHVDGERRRRRGRSACRRIVGAMDAQRAGGERERARSAPRRPRLIALGRAGEAEGDMHDIVARRQGDVGCGSVDSTTSGARRRDRAWAAKTRQCRPAVQRRARRRASPTGAASPLGSSAALVGRAPPPARGRRRERDGYANRIISSALPRRAGPSSARARRLTRNGADEGGLQARRFGPGPVATPPAHS